MINGRSVLAFIPARGGSKGIPKKNLLKLQGKELIAYTIESAKNTGICDEIIVSTDSTEIAEVAKRYSALIPFYRPEKFAQDKSQMIDVIMHAMNWYGVNENVFDIFLYLQPTSPLRNSSHILEAFEVFFGKEADTVISLSESDCNPERIKELPSDLNMAGFITGSDQFKNRQDFPTYYELNGAIHIAAWQILEKQKSWYVKNSYGYVIDDPYGLDIDTELDYQFAEFLLEKGYVYIE